MPLVGFQASPGHGEEYWRGAEDSSLDALTSREQLPVRVSQPAFIDVNRLQSMVSQ